MKRFPGVSGAEPLTLKLGRRHAVLGVLVAAACKKEDRCKQCGMKIDPASAWTAELVLADGSTVRFDTPRCALVSWRSGKTAAVALRAQEYYERRWRDAAELRFVRGGDVLGPMGPDFVPVDPSRANKFIQDHGADAALTLGEITVELLGRP